VIPLVMVTSIVSDSVGDGGGGGGGDFGGVLSGESGKIGSGCWGEAESVGVIRLLMLMSVLSSMLVNSLWSSSIQWCECCHLLARCKSTDLLLGFAGKEVGQSVVYVGL